MAWMQNSRCWSNSPTMVSITGVAHMHMACKYKYSFQIQLIWCECLSGLSRGERKGLAEGQSEEEGLAGRKRITLRLWMYLWAKLSEEEKGEYMGGSKGKEKKNVWGTEWQLRRKREGEIEKQSRPWKQFKAKAGELEKERETEQGREKKRELAFHPVNDCGVRNGISDTLLQHIAAWRWVIEDSHCLFLTYCKVPRDYCGTPKVLCWKAKMGVWVTEDKLLSGVIDCTCWQSLDWLLWAGLNEISN